MSLSTVINRFVRHKQALGHRYRGESWLLLSLREHLEAHGYRDLEAEGFSHWFATFRDAHPNTRRKWYQIVRHFCIHRRRSEPTCFVPALNGTPRRQPYVSPVIVAPEQIARMLAKAFSLTPTTASPLRPHALRMAVVLLYTCGLRLGELLRLKLADVMEHKRVLCIRESKFHKTRFVPMSKSSARELHGYLQVRRKIFPSHPDTPLLCTRHGAAIRPYSKPGMQGAMNRLIKAAKVQNEQGRHPRIHDLRHTFAVQRLIGWYREGADVQSCLPKLALYMGHVSIESSAYYLHWVPTIQHLASERFERRFGYFLQGGSR